MALLKCGLGLGKDRGDQLHVSIVRAYVHAAVVAHDEALNGALLGMETGVDRDQPPVRLEGVSNRLQHARRELIVQMVQDSNGNGNVGRSKGVVSEIANVIADEFAVTGIYPARTRDVSFIAIEPDIGRSGGQAAQKCSRTATNIEHPIASAGPQDIFGELPQPSSRANQMVEKFINPRTGERGPKTAAFAHGSSTAVGTGWLITRPCERLRCKELRSQ